MVISAGELVANAEFAVIWSKKKRGATLSED